MAGSLKENNCFFHYGSNSMPKAIEHFLKYVDHTTFFKNALGYSRRCKLFTAPALQFAIVGLAPGLRYDHGRQTQPLMSLTPRLDSRLKQGSWRKDHFGRLARTLLSRKVGSFDVPVARMTSPFSFRKAVQKPKVP
jgi:hypothetical protein